MSEFIDMGAVVKTADLNIEEVSTDAFDYELRGLKATDLGAICKIISAIGVKEFKHCFESAELKAAIKGGNADIEAVGIGVMFDIVGIITSNIPKAEKELQAFVCSVAGISAPQFRLLSLADYGELIMRIVMMPDFKDFFMRAFKLFK